MLALRAPAVRARAVRARAVRFRAVCGVLVQTRSPCGRATESYCSLRLSRLHDSENSDPPIQVLAITGSALHQDHPIL